MVERSFAALDLLAGLNQRAEAQAYASAVQAIERAVDAALPQDFIRTGNRGGIAGTAEAKAITYRLQMDIGTNPGLASSMTAVNGLNC